MIINFSSDIVFLLVLFVIFFAYALYFGQGRLISLILSFYPAQFFYEHLPDINQLIFMKGNSGILINKIIIFLVILILINILVGRYVFHDSGFGSAHYLRMAGLSLSMVLLILTFSYSTLSLSILHTFSPSISVLFSTPTYIFLWQLAPLALLFVL